MSLKRLEWPALLENEALFCKFKIQETWLEALKKTCHLIAPALQLWDRIEQSHTHTLTHYRIPRLRVLTLRHNNYSYYETVAVYIDLADMSTR